jgi:prepilin-type N-terminal cleavage/methylation domain-containing protein
MPHLPAQGKNRAGLTLIEVVVVLVVLGLAAALVSPAFRSTAEPDEGLRSVLAAARDVAVRRAETLILNVDERGAWRITAVADSTSVASGRFSDGTGQLRVRVSPVGACFSEGVGTWSLDAVSCTLVLPRSRSR